MGSEPKLGQVGMKMLPPLPALASLRTTLVLLTLLAFVLFLNVALPQEATLGERAFLEIAKSSAVNRFVLLELGLGRLSTHPIFIGLLIAFFLQLALVLTTRAGPVWSKMKPRKRSAAGLDSWTRAKGGLARPRPASWEASTAVDTLRGFGYQVQRVGPQTFWGVKHPTAALGFLLFHLSFFLLCAGGILIYTTRFVGVVMLVEGQWHRGRFQIRRSPPLGRPPDLEFSLEDVEARFDRGMPVHLEARFILGQGESRKAWINHPAKWGATRLLVQQVGLAPLLWLQDGEGYTLDRRAAPTKTLSPDSTRLSLAENRYALLVHPPEEPVLPTRDELSTTALRLEVFIPQSTLDDPEARELLFEGSLRPGEAASLGDERLVLEDLRYWVEVLVVSERGGGLLIAGFVIGILGLFWRLMLHRREVALSWDEEELRLVGSSEYFPERFREELDSILATLTSDAGGG